LQEIIDAENKKQPSSDDELVKELAKHGLTVARRTVTKYRKSMNIASSRQRRLWTGDDGPADAADDELGDDDHSADVGAMDGLPAEDSPESLIEEVAAGNSRPPSEVGPAPLTSHDLESSHAHAAVTPHPGLPLAGHADQHRAE